MFVWSLTDRLPYSIIAAGILLWSHTAIGGDDPPRDKSVAPTIATEQKACIDPATRRLVSPEERPECRTMLRRDRDEARTDAGTAGQTSQTTEGLTEERLPK